MDGNANPNLKIDADMVWSWDPCYGRDLVDRLFETPKSIVEVLTLKDGAWSEVSPLDRIWGVCRPELLPESIIHLFACWCAEQALPIFEEQSPDDDRPRNAIAVKRRWVAGEADDKELAAAGAAARAAAGAVAVSFAGSPEVAAAGGAAGATAGAAAGVAAGVAARAVAWAVAWVAVRYAAQDAQVAKLADMVRVWTETGDVFGGEGM